jgi:hypothetical protein
LFGEVSDEITASLIPKPRPYEYRHGVFFGEAKEEILSGLLLVNDGKEFGMMFEYVENNEEDIAVSSASFFL